MNIFLDLDGVLVGFIDGLCRRFDKPNPYEQDSALGRWNCYELMGLTGAEVAEALDDPDFWRQLEYLPDAPGIVLACIEAAGPRNVWLLSDTSGFAGAARGKADWVREHLTVVPLYLFHPIPHDSPGAGKARLAKPDTVLVDDSDLNVAAYRKAGGLAILVPRLWNSRHAEAHRAAEITKGELANIILGEGAEE